jgi:hypothetical protein
MYVRYKRNGTNQPVTHTRSAYYRTFFELDGHGTVYLSTYKVPIVSSQVSESAYLGMAGSKQGTKLSGQRLSVEARL